MTIAAGVSSKGTSGSTPVTTSNVTTTASGSSFVVGIIRSVTGVTITSVTDSKSNTYTQLGTGQVYGAGDAFPGEVHIYYSADGTGGTNHNATVAWTGTSAVTVFFLEVTGGTTSPVDSPSAAQIEDTSSPYTVTSGTFAQAIELAIALCGSNASAAGSTSNESTGFTIQQSETDSTANWSGCIATKVTSSTTALTPSFTVVSSTKAGLIIVGFKDSGSVSGPVVAWLTV